MWCVTVREIRFRQKYGFGGFRITTVINYSWPFRGPGAKEHFVRTGGRGRPYVIETAAVVRREDWNRHPVRSGRRHRPGTPKLFDAVVTPGKLEKRRRRVPRDPSRDARADVPCSVIVIPSSSSSSSLSSSPCSSVSSSLAYLETHNPTWYYARASATCILNALHDGSIRFTV